jgi:hypothetical protein
MQLYPILDFRLNINKKTFHLNTKNFETNLNCIFAIEDIFSYPPKLKLILSMFHKNTLTSQCFFKYPKPHEKLTFKFTTTSKATQHTLRIKK